MIPRGGGHYSASSLERGLSTETFMPNERVDIYAHLARKDRVGWIRGLKYVKHVPERHEIIFRKDAQSGPWKGREFGTRLSALLAANPGWTSSPCPGCKGHGGRRVKVDGEQVAFVTCSTCGGTGDLLDTAPIIDGEPYRNGFPKRITPALDLYGIVPFVRSVGCRLEEVGSEVDDCGPGGGSRCPKCRNSIQNATPDGSPNHRRCASCKHVWLFRTFSPSPWAAAVATSIGTLREFRVTDREPVGPLKHHDGYVWSWDRRPTLRRAEDLPPTVFDSLDGGTLVRDGTVRTYPTAALAVSALGRAMHRLVKGGVKA